MKGDTCFFLCAKSSAIRSALILSRLFKSCSFIKWNKMCPPNESTTIATIPAIHVIGHQSKGRFSQMIYDNNLNRNYHMYMLTRFLDWYRACDNHWVKSRTCMTATVSTGRMVCSPTTRPALAMERSVEIQLKGVTTNNSVCGITTNQSTQIILISEYLEKHLQYIQAPMFIVRKYTTDTISTNRRQHWLTFLFGQKENSL